MPPVRTGGSGRWAQDRLGDAVLVAAGIIGGGRQAGEPDQVPAKAALPGEGDPLLPAGEVGDGGQAGPLIREAGWMCIAGGAVDLEAAAPADQGEVQLPGS